MDIDQDLLDRVRKRAEAEGLSFREALNQALFRGLAKNQPKREPYVMPVFDIGLDPSINVDKINDYLADLDDEEFIRKHGIGEERS